MPGRWEGKRKRLWGARTVCPIFRTVLGWDPGGSTCPFWQAERRNGAVNRASGACEKPSQMPSWISRSFGKRVTFSPNEANCLSSGRREDGLAFGQAVGAFCVILAKSGIQKVGSHFGWIPACAGTSLDCCVRRNETGFPFIQLKCYGKGFPWAIWMPPRKAAPGCHRGLPGKRRGSRFSWSRRGKTQRGISRKGLWECQQRV